MAVWRAFLGGAGHAASQVGILVFVCEWGAMSTDVKNPDSCMERQRPFSFLSLVRLSVKAKESPLPGMHVMDIA